jgi:hypothetical protein
VWNRQRFIKDPETGRRLTRLNDESKGITPELPELRIVLQELWDMVKARQRDLGARARARKGARERPEGNPRGIEARLVRNDLERITASRSLEDDTAGGERSAATEPLLHPAMAQRYRGEVENLRNALDRQDAQRSHGASPRVDRKDTKKERDALRIDLHGDASRGS